MVENRVALKEKKDSRLLNQKSCVIAMGALGAGLFPLDVFRFGFLVLN